MVIISECGISYRLNDASKFQCSDSGATQKRCEQEVVSWTDNDYIKFIFIYGFKNAVTPPACSKKHKFFPSSEILRGSAVETPGTTSTTAPTTAGDKIQRFVAY